MSHYADMPRRLIVGVDLVASSGMPNHVLHPAVDALYRVLDAAWDDAGRHAGRAGLADEVQRDRQEAAESCIDLLPPDVPEARVVGRFVPALGERLAAVAADPATTFPLRLRVAIGHGPAVLDSGVRGTTVNQVCRLREAAQAKDALTRHPAALLAVVLAPDVHTHAVVGGGLGLRPDDFGLIRVIGKRTDVPRVQDGWLHVPGVAPPFPDVQLPGEAPVRPGGLIHPDGPLPPL